MAAAVYQPSLHFKTLELLQFGLYRTDGKTVTVLNLAHVERPIWDDSEKDVSWKDLEMGDIVDD